MKKLLLPLAMLAMFTIPATASAAEHCRNAKGQFAKCGTPGAVPDSQYVSKGEKAAGVKPKAAPMPKAAPAAAPAVAAPVKAGGPCKDAKGKFIKCGAAPAAAAPVAPAAKPAAAAPAAPAKKGPCKDEKGKFIKCAA